MTYTIVFRDHAGEWHALTLLNTWQDACVAFAAAAMTLVATDYYDDAWPTVVKIIDARGGSGSDYYAQAPALQSEVTL